MSVTQMARLNDLTAMSGSPTTSTTREEEAFFCGGDPCPQTRFRSGIWWNRRGEV